MDEIKITDIDIPFNSLVKIMFKVILASIPGALGAMVIITLCIEFIRQFSMY